MAGHGKKMERRFPIYLSQTLQILWFEVDDLSIFMCFFVLAMMFDGLVLWALAFILPYAYSKAKKKYPRGFLKHILYFAGLTDLKGYPCYYEKDFHE